MLYEVITGINQIENKTDIQYLSTYPNPTNGNFCIDYESEDIGRIVLVITSYSIHYTKLYDVDSAIVLFGLAAFHDWQIPLYSWLTIYITGKAIDVTLEGVSYHKSYNFV